MPEEKSVAQPEWLAMSDEEFEDIRAKAELILRTIPTLLDKVEAEARATLALDANHAIESLSRKRLTEQLIDSAKGRLDQATTTRGLVAMLDSTWRCLAAVRRANSSESGGPASPQRQNDGG
jgi:hypothetical protein